MPDIYIKLMPDIYIKLMPEMYKAYAWASGARQSCPRLTGKVPACLTGSPGRPRFELWAVINKEFEHTGGGGCWRGGGACREGKGKGEGSMSENQHRHFA